jgi:uncharacterized membrane protein
VITDPTAVFFALAAVVAVSLALEQRFRFFRTFGAALVGILLGMVLSNTGIIPGQSPAYTFLVGPGVSAGIVLILLSVDVRTVVQAGPKMLAAFAIGAVGSMVGAAVGALLLSGSVGPETWKLAGQYAATYTGGGANFAAVGAALGTSGELFAAGIAADVIVTAVWMMACLAVPVLLSRAGGGGASGAPEAEDIDHAAAAGKLYASAGAVSLLDVGLLVVIVFGTLWTSRVLGDVLAPVPSVLWLTTIALLLAQIPRVGRIRGAGVLGNYAVLLFLASNGAKSVVANILAVGPPVVYFALVTVAVHGVVIFGLGSLVGLDLRTLAVASQANVGGPATAMALATARGYTDRLLPGVAVGLLGYAVGNYIGFAVAVAVRAMLGA